MKAAPFLYNILIRTYSSAIKMAAPFHGKARRLQLGHRGLLPRIESQLQHEKNPKVWFHCASLGEFEQGRPLMEAFKKEYPQFRIVLTFFSPSGYEIRKNYPGADYIFYLPFDTPGKARRFVKAVNPALAFFVKYEFWYNYLFYLHQHAVPSFLISGIFRPNQLFFKKYGSFYRQMLPFFQHLFVQNEASLTLLKSIGVSHASKSGDTRFDRATALCREAREIPLAEAFRQALPLLVVGSSWAPDLELIAPLLHRFKGKLRCIIAPHEVDEDHLKEAESILNGLQLARFSKADFSSVEKADVLLIDNVGMLSALYALADYAYVGGGLGKGLHNTLEAATYGMPIFFGNKAYHKFQEAIDLLKSGGAFAVGNTNELQQQFLLLYEDGTLRKKAAKASAAYVQANTGATRHIMNHISTLLNKKYARQNI